MRGSRRQRGKERKKRGKKRSTERQRRKPRDRKGRGGQQPPGSSQRRGGKHKRGERARRAEKWETNKINTPQRPRPRATGAGNQRKPETKGAHKKKGEKKPQAGEGGKKNKAPRPKAPGAGNQRKQGTKGARRRRRKENKKEGGGGGTRGGETKDQERGNSSPKGAGQGRNTERPEENMRRTNTRPGGRPARPGQDGRAHADTHGTPTWHPLNRKGRCRRPHEIAPVHRPSPLSNDGQYGKPDASVTASTHTNHRTQPKTDAGGTCLGQPHRGAQNGYDAEQAQRPCLGVGQRQAQ